MLGAAAVLQPAHDGAVAPGHLHAVDAEVEVIGPVALRPRAAGHHQRPGDQRRRLARPAGLHRQAPEIDVGALRSEEHTSELQSLMRISYAVFCLKKKNRIRTPILKHTLHILIRTSSYPY